MSSRFITAMRVQLLLILLQLANTHGIQHGASTEIFTRTYPSTAYHIEQDLANEDQLMISTYGALSTIGTGGEASLIVGADRAGYSEGIGSYARFNLISGFRQVNRTHVIAVDQRNHCLRYIDRDSKSTSAFAGKCKEYGYANGRPTDARFYNPYTLIDGYYLNEFYLTDTGNNAVRLLTLTSEQITVSTLSQSPSILNQPFGIALDCIRKQLYVSVQYGLVQIDIKQQNLKQLSSLDKGFSEGDLQSSKFDTVYKIVPMSSSLYLVADFGKEALRIMDVDHQTVETLVCEDVQKSSDLIPCEVKKPYSISFSSGGDKLFIGQRNNIKVIAMEGVSEMKNLKANCTRLHKPTTTPITTTTSKGPGGKWPRTFETRFNWLTGGIIIILVVVIVLLINLSVVTMLKLRKQRRRNRRNAEIGNHRNILTSTEEETTPEYEDLINTTLPREALVRRNASIRGDQYESLIKSRRSFYSPLDACSTFSIASQTPDTFLQRLSLVPPEYVHPYDNAAVPSSSLSNSSTREDINLVHHELKKERPLSGKLSTTSTHTRKSKSAENIIDCDMFPKLTDKTSPVHHKSDQFLLNKQ